MTTSPSMTIPSLPPLAGLASFAEAERPGLGVADCVARLRRFHFALRHLHQIFIAHIPDEPVYELKMAFSYHAYLCAKGVEACTARVAEMREPPLGLDAVPHPALAQCFDEILATPNTVERLVGVYEVAVPALCASLERYLAETNPLADAPTARLCRHLLVDLADLLNYGRQSVAALRAAQATPTPESWQQHLVALLAAAGGLDGTDPIAPEMPPPIYATEPFVTPHVPRRDARFFDPYNMGVNAEAFIYDDHFPAQAKLIMLAYKRLREIDVPEMMATIIADTPDQPWDYYLALTRQLWDEARHAMMGEVAFHHLGLDWATIPINFTWSLGLNTQLTPLERHGVLYFIEQGLMPKTGKRYEWEIAQTAHDALFMTIQDFDWADEVLHAHIGRAWYVTHFPTTSAAQHFGDAAWSRVLIDWGAWRDQGLTQHANWWPSVYQTACERWGIAPDPAALAFDLTYEGARADRKTLPAAE